MVPDNEQDVSLVEKPEAYTCTVEPTAPEVGLSMIVVWEPLSPTAKVAEAKS
jgi:hypothetical protein